VASKLQERVELGRETEETKEKRHQVVGKGVKTEVHGKT